MFVSTATGRPTVHRGSSSAAPSTINLTHTPGRGTVEDTGDDQVAVATVEGGIVRHVRLSLLTSDPAQIANAIQYLEDEARAKVEDQPGNVGISLIVNPELAVALVGSFWVSGDAMRESEKMSARSASRRRVPARARCPSSTTRSRVSCSHGGSGRAAGLG